MSLVQRLLNTSVGVWRAAQVDDGGGGQQETWFLVDTYRSRLSQPWARDRISADQHNGLLTHVAYFSPEADVRQGDELRHEGRTFQVLVTFQPSKPGTYLRADCTSRQPETGGR